VDAVAGAAGGGAPSRQLGYDTLWTWDHLYPIVGETTGPNYEGWLTITAWAARTERVRLGLMVGANPYREPSLVAKMVFERNRAKPWKPSCGPPERIAEQLAPLVELGYRHLIANFPADYDEESMTRFATEVRPLLERV
jgi:alkanesulfonate monooxygenase SsuD/methylene tetrahydromethanopterin reductase-like flavin-dependent oxidoreductase (luciferase family)